LTVPFVASAKIAKEFSGIIIHVFLIVEGKAF